MIRWPWRWQYRIVIVGRESGHTAPIEFLRFRRRATAEAWAAKLNANRMSAVAFFEVRHIDDDE